MVETGTEQCLPICKPLPTELFSLLTRDSVMPACFLCKKMTKQTLQKLQLDGGLERINHFPLPFPGIKKTENITVLLS